MRRKTYLTKRINTADVKAQYDAQAKKIVADNYDDIKKVYSIWLCLNAPDREADSIVCYKIVPKTLVGELEENHHRYDLLNLTMIGLNKDSYKKRVTDLLGYLGTIFSEELTPGEKLRRLDDEYDVSPTLEIKEGMKAMCNLSDAIEERGIQQGIVMSKKEAMKSLVEKVRKKMEKGKEPALICEELDEDRIIIEKICLLLKNKNQTSEKELEELLG